MKKATTPTALAPCTVITVTYNSQKHIGKAMECLQQQTTPPSQIILVDSGSNDYTYLDPFRLLSGTSIVIGEKNSGFCRANNLGMQHVDRHSDYVLFLNPDAFLTPKFLQAAVTFMEQPENQDIGILTGSLLGYDIEANCPTGKYDSTGIFRTWYGRWYDRDQGMEYKRTKYSRVGSPSAICGALMFCRKMALLDVYLRDQEVFDSSFYMYKEDIDLSLRVKQKGWNLAFHPELEAYHCRGWQADRSKMPREFRLCSARNEWRIHSRTLSPCSLYSMAKLAAVKLFNI